MLYNSICNNVGIYIIFVVAGKNILALPECVGKVCC